MKNVHCEIGGRNVNTQSLRTIWWALVDNITSVVTIKSKSLNFLQISSDKFCGNHLCARSIVIFSGPIYSCIKNTWRSPCTFPETLTLRHIFRAYNTCGLGADQYIMYSTLSLGMCTDKYIPFSIIASTFSHTIQPYKNIIITPW